MLTFKNFLTERYLNLFDVNDKQKYKDEVFNMLQKAYAPMGGMKGSGFKDADDMAKNIPMWKLAKKNDKIVAGVMYKDKEGRKRVASFTDGTPEGQKQLADIMKSDLDRAFMEVSERSFGFLRKILGDDTLLKYAIDPTKAKELLKEKDTDWNSNVPEDDPHIMKAPKLKKYFYQRKIGGHFHTKIMLGKHGKTIITEETENNLD